MSKTLLLADDSVTIQKVVAISFASEDVEIATVDNGDDAVTRARELRPDLILADVVMPGRNGYEVCEAVKADPALRHIPVLLLTGTFEAFDEQRAERAGAAGHVAKPFEAQALVQRVRELLSAAAQPAGAPAATAAPPAVEPADESSEDEGFAFFDDESDDAVEYRGESRLSSAELELAPGDSAFSFGDEDWSNDDSDPALEPLQPVAHTVAILPDEPPVSAVEVEMTSPAAAPEETDDRFDFEFESVSARPRETQVDSFGRDAVLDPPADSGFVDPAPSQADLSAPAPSMPAAEATQVLSSDFELVRPEAPATPAGQVTDPFPEERDDPVAAEAPAPADELFEETPMPPLPTRPAAERPAPLAAPAADLSETEADFAEPEPDFVEAEPVAHEDDDTFAPTRAPSHGREAVLERLTPQLRDQLHETLERAAWEAFGQVTEKIVAQSVEKLEKIAWEVVPKLAETLIQEEIRKLKDGD